MHYHWLIRDKARFWTTRAFRSLDAVNADLFACLLYPDYPDNVYLFERRLHVQKVRYLHAITELRAASSEFAEKIDFLFDILMDLAALRRRVSDHTLFRVCSNELQAVTGAVSDVFKQLVRIAKHHDVTIDTYPLEQKINHLEENYQSVLRVTAREPLAFLLFINSLKILRERLELLYD